MFKVLIMSMNYVTWTKWQLLAIASGVLLGWTACDLWKEAYDDARKGGAVA